MGNLVGCSWILFWKLLQFVNRLIRVQNVCCFSVSLILEWSDWQHFTLSIYYNFSWALIILQKGFSIIKNPNNFTATDESSPVQICMCSTMFLHKSKALLSFAHCIQKGTLEAWKLLCWEEELFRSRMFSSCALSMVEPLREAILRIRSCLNSTSHGPLILKIPSYRISKGP